MNLGESHPAPQSRQKSRRPAKGARPVDIFVCHADEDREAVVDPLVRKLRALGLTIWYRPVELRLGDDRHAAVERGLRCAAFAVVVASPRLLVTWRRGELSLIFELEAREQRARILPVRCDLTEAGLTRLAPMLATRVSVGWDEGVDVVARRIADAVRGRRGAGRAARIGR